MATKLDDIVTQAADQLRKRVPNAPEAYIQEWSKRFKAQINFDDYEAVIVRAYETHFTAPELHELATATRDGKAGKQVVLSDGLKAKLGSQMTTVQSEVIGGSSQLGAKLGGDIDVALHKEHPEWFTADKL